ncbi:MAG: MFS transporter, partial [Patescibacteria group bacterium]
AIGFGAAIVQLCKVIVELPLSKILDKNHGEYDDFYSLMIGSTLIACVPFAYLFAHSIHHIYIIQAVYGVGIAFSVPPWYAIFSRHIDKMQESFEWTLDSVSIGLAAAAAAAVGGMIAQKFGFNTVFIIGGVFAICGGLMQIMIFRDIKRKVPRGQVKPEPDKVSL